MVQSAAPSVGTVEDGFRFKGGDPKQESSWEQVEPVAAQGRGPGVMQDVEGRLFRIGRDGQRIEVPGGTPGGSGASALVGADARARFMINLGPLVDSQGVLERMDGEGYTPDSDLGARALENIPFDGGFFARKFGGEDYNAYSQAAKTFEAAILPIMSGAAVTPTEAQRLIRAALPQAGDSPEVLAQKSRQRRQMINAVAQGIGQDVPFGDVGVFGQPEQPREIDPATGLPTYSDVTQTGSGDAPLPPGGLNPSGGEPVDITGMSAEQLLQLQPGQALRLPDGTVTRLTGAPSVGASGREVSPGVFAQETPEQAVAARDEMNPILRRVDGAVRGAADAMTFGFADELAAAGDTLIGRGSYDQNIQRQRAIDQADSKAVPVSRGAGQFAGAVAAPGAMAAGRFVASAPSVGYAMTRGAATGAVAGAAYGAGNAQGGAVERAQGAGAGAVVGGLVGGALPPVARGAGAMTSGLTRPISNAVGDGVRAMTGRGLAPEEKAARSLMRGTDLASMEEQAANFRRYGAEPTIADIGGSSVQGRTRVAATRQTPGRDAAQDFSAGRRSEVQDFTAGLGRRISPTEATPQQLDTALEGYQRAASGPEFAAARAAPPITLDEGTTQALWGPEGRAAMQSASRLYQSSADPAERALAQELTQLANGGPTPQMSVGAADLISRYLQKAGAPGTNEGRIFGALGTAVRDAARSQSGEYDAALTGYAQRASLGDATAIGERFMGRGHTGDFTQAVGNMGEGEVSVARAAARAALDKAGETARGAPGALDTLATGRGQQARSTALLGPEGAADLRQGAQVGRRMVETAANVNPRAGSNTFLNGQDGQAMGQVGGIVGNLARGRPISAMGGVVDLIRSAGISDKEAETIVRLATDPSRTDEVLNILRTRFPDQEARRIVSQLTPAIAGQSGASAQPRMVGPQP